MIVLYGILGVVASIGLALYSMLTVLFIYWFEITLTLPGIAGIILGIGMAVDANVIVFARIREEIAGGKSVLAAVNEGKVNLLAMATDAAQKAGAHAGNLIKAVAAIVGGGGGGRPNMAQAGGKNPAKAQEAVDAAAGILEGQIK